MNAATIASWLLTYLVHSTILLAAAWLAARYLGDRRLALQEAFLRTALIGGLLTATMQVGLGVEPIGGPLVIDELSVGEAAVFMGSTASQTVMSEGAVLPNPDSAIGREGLWSAVLVSLWALGSMMALAILGRSILDLRRLLETRRFRPTGQLLERLASAMGFRRSVRLSTSPAIAVPFATGIRRPEICCPERVGDLAHEHQKSLFAHELGHLARRDPMWQLLYRLGEAVLFLQPLNRLVRRRLEEIAEHLTDERAVACTGDRLGLARCLVVVAHWGVSNPPGVPATAFAAGPRLDRRVRHLISGAPEQRRSGPWAVPLLVALLFASVLLLPAIMPPAAHANISPLGSDAAPVQPWSPAVDETDAPAPPAAPSAPEAGELPPPPAPVNDSAPSPSAVPRSVAPPSPPVAPGESVEPVPAVAPEPRSEPAPPRAPEPRRGKPAPQASPTAPEPPSDTEKTTPAETTQRDSARADARARQREAHRERAEVEARARAEARALRAESRELADRARELAREAAEQHRMTEGEREKLRQEHRELQRQTQLEARERARLSRERSRELAERSRELAREAAERSRLSEAERDELRRQARERQAEFQERAKELAERARELAEQAEEERRTPENVE